jgi:2-oxo-hept-3-ene-1,7-dioate hydratase
LAFTLKEPLSGPGVGIDDALRATACVTPALELCANRIQGPRTLADTVADNASGGGCVLGSRSVPPADVDLHWVAATLSRNRVIEESGVSASVMGNPAAAVAWLANALGAQGRELAPGDVVLSGAFARAVSVAAGDAIHANFGPLGAIDVKFG